MTPENDRSRDRADEKAHPARFSEQEVFDGAEFFLKCITIGVLIVYLTAAVRISFGERDTPQGTSTSSAVVTSIG